jgi:hypothetical protein
MAAQPAVAPTSAGATVTEIAGAGVGVDTYTAGTVLLARNTGAVTHTVTIVCNATIDGLGVASRAIGPIPATTGIRLIRIPASYGDASGQANVWVDVNGGAVTDVKFYPIGA